MRKFVGKSKAVLFLCVMAVMLVFCGCDNTAQKESELAEKKQQLIATADEMAEEKKFDVAIDTIKTWEGYAEDADLSAKIEAYEKAKTEYEAKRTEVITTADRQALSYDYDAAIATIEGYVGYEEDAELVAKIAEYKATKASCVRVDMSDVTHIFYHSLVVDPDRCFNPNSYQGKGNYQWMTTIDEFNAITQEMYERGFVILGIHDLYEITTDENGKEIMKEADIYLPKGKKPVVLSFDDLSYYHSYTGFGFASKLVLDENGNVTCEYIDADGNVLYGDYDYVPILDKFIAEHPDASYRGAKATVALTGYNGIFGYRTDESYSLDTPDLDRDKRQWMLANPDFSVAEERAEAQKIADAMKASGWTFASHTWGHLRVGTSKFSSLKRDNEKWQKNVASIVGETNVIIFAHGQDLGKWGNYNLSDEKVQYFMEQGFNVFCNVDSNEYRTHFGSSGTYLRQGRRNLDGIRFWYNLTGEQDNLSDLFDVEDIIDPDRPDYTEYK